VNSFGSEVIMNVSLDVESTFGDCKIKEIKKIAIIIADIPIIKKIFWFKLV